MKSKNQKHLIPDQLFAEFMGLRVDHNPSDKNTWWYVDLNNTKSIFHNQSVSLFHKDWNWLMAVWHKYRDVKVILKKHNEHYTQNCNIIKAFLPIETPYRFYLTMSAAIKIYNKDKAGK